jgi:ribose 5-phosphate isomerase A
MISAVMSPEKSREQLEREKQAAALAALRWVRSGMTLGLGTGSTADYFIDLVGERVRAGSLQVEAVASSEASEARAAAAGVPMISPRRGLRLDLTVDGADEIDPDLGLIKGRGAALLREQVLAQASDYFLVIADSSKRVARLGVGGLPIEVVPFALPWVMDQIEKLGGKAVVLMDRKSPEKVAISDQQNYLLDCRFGAIEAPESLGARLDRIAGVAGHGLFLGCARAAVVAEGSEVTVLRCDCPPTPAARFDRLPEGAV